MIPKPYSKHSFVKQYLNYKGNELYAGTKRILTYSGSPEYPLEPIHTEFEVVPDYDAEKPKKIQLIKKYQHLRDLGFSIVGRRAPGLYWTGQRTKYILARSYPGIKHTKKMPYQPYQHHVEFDINNKRIRIVGPNTGPRGVGEWVSIEKTRKKKEKRIDTFNIQDYMVRPREVIENVQKNFLNLPEESLLVKVPELEVLLTETGELVCIAQSKNAPTVLFCGIKGSGKSYAMHSTIDRAFWKSTWNVRICCLNDSLRETGTWSLPMTGQDAELSNLSQYPRPLPIVHLAPMTDEKLEILHPNEIGFAMSLPYKTIMHRFYDYFNLDKSKPYFEKMLDKIMNAKDLIEIMDIIETNVDNKLTRDKILAHITSLFNKKILDINTKVPSVWKVKTPGFTAEYNPITACVVAGIIPVLDSGMILTKDYYPQYFKYIADDIFQRQSYDPYFRQKNMEIWVVMEELLDVAARNQRNVALEITKKLVTQGRPKRIGFLSATQNFAKIEDRIQSNMTYIFTFTNPKDASAIVNQYNIASRWKDEIKSLPKFECVAITTEEFVVYTPDGKRYKSKGPFKGKFLPPMSLHKAPREEN